MFRVDDLSYRGKSVEKFEKILSEYTGAYCIATNTGTAALHLALILSGVGQGDYVLCPAISYVATANAISYTGAQPIFCDVKDDLTIDVEKLKDEHIFNDCKAIIPVDLLGQPCEMKEIMKFSRKHNLKVINDSAQALGSFYHGKHCGTIGDFGIISFNGNKIITTGGGGCLMTKSKKMRDKALHLSTVAKVQGIDQCYHDQIGYNYRMPAWNARLGIHYFYGNARLKKLKQRAKKEEIVCNGWSKIDNEGLPIWTPLHKLPAYKKCLRMGCSNAERIGREVKIKVNCKRVKK